MAILYCTSLQLINFEVILLRQYNKVGIYGGVILKGENYRFIGQYFVKKKKKGFLKFRYAVIL